MLLQLLLHECVWACERASGRSAASLSLSRSPPPPPIYTFFFPLCLVFSALCPRDSTSPKWPEYLAGQSEFGFVSWAEPVVSVDGRFAIDTCRTRRTLFTCRKDSQVSWWREIWRGCTTVPLLVYTLLYCIILYYIICKLNLHSSCFLVTFCN